MDPRRFGPHTYPKGPYAEAKAIDEFHEMYQVRLPVSKDSLDAR